MTPAQLTVSHAGQNNTITLLLTRTWHTSHLLPLDPHTDWHMLAHEQTYLKNTHARPPHTHARLFFFAIIYTLRKCFKPHTVCFPVMAHLWPLFPSFSSASIYLWGCREGSHRPTHFLSFCLPKRCKQASQTNMFSLETGLAGEEKRGLVKTHILTH